MNTETMNNVRRIAYALYCATGDAAAMRTLANVLHYDQTQLERDITDLENVTAELARAEREGEED